MSFYNNKCPTHFTFSLCVETILSTIYHILSKKYPSMCQIWLVPCASLRAVSHTSQTRSRQRLLPATMTCCRFLGCQHCLQPLFLRCSCDLLKGDLGQYSAGRPNRRHSTSCVDKINSSLLCCFQTGSEVHLAFPSLGIRNIFLGGKENRS